MGGFRSGQRKQERNLVTHFKKTPEYCRGKQYTGLLLKRNLSLRYFPHGGFPFLHMIHELLQLMKDFEQRNNISVYLHLCSDGSGDVIEFWNDNELESFDDEDQLNDILKNSTYRKDESGYCINPIEKT